MQNTIHNTAHGPAPAASDIRGWQAAGFVLLMLVLVRGTWFGDPTATYDEQLYSFIGWRMGAGELPYMDWWDRKPFGLFAIFGAAHAIFGPEALAYQLLAAAFTGAAAWLTYRLARDVADRFTSAVAAVLLILLLPLFGSQSAQSEVFFIPLMLAMVWLLRDPAHPQALRRAMLAMFVGGVALQVKYTVLPQCLFLGGYALWGQWKNGQSLTRLTGVAGMFALLGLLPTLLVGAFYAAAGGFDAWLFANFLSFFERLPSNGSRIALSQVGFLAPLILLAALGICASLRIVPAAHRSRQWLIAGWALSSLATVMLPATVYGYYYAALIAPLVLLALPAFDRSGKLRAVPAIVLLAGALLMANLPGNRAYATEQEKALDRLVTAIAPHVGSDANCLMVYDGPTVLYRLTGGCAPSRLVYPDHLNNQLESGALGVLQSAEVARILATRPGAIVTATTSLTPQNPVSTALVDAAIFASYREAARVELREREIVAWVRK